MRKLSLSRAWDETKSIVAHDGRLLGSVALALVFLPQIVMAVVGLPLGAQASLASRIVYFLVILLGLTAQIALNRLAIGPSITVGGAIRRGLERLGPMLAAMLLLIIALTFLLIVIGIALGATGLAAMPGEAEVLPAWLVILLILMTALSFGIFQLLIPVAAAEQGGPIHLFSRSWQLARGNYLRLLAFIVLIIVGIFIVALASQFALGTLIVAFLGEPRPWSLSALALGIFAGVIQVGFTVLTAVMLARIYVQLAGGAGAQPSVPRSGT